MPNRGGRRDSPIDENRATLPADVRSLLGASDAAAQERAWAAFLESYSRVILHAAKSTTPDYDTAMDRYTYAVEALRKDEFRRLRGYSADGRAKFTAWLTVIVRRLCFDQHRQRYGRAQLHTDPDSRVTRRRIADLLATELDVEQVKAAAEASPEADIRQRELAEILDHAVRRVAPRDRALLALRFEDDLPVRDIAQILGFPTLFHVYRRLNRILGELRQGLEARGVDDSTP